MATTQSCRHCASDQVRKNSSSGGRAKYQCRACAYQGYLCPPGPSRAAPLRAGGAAALVERNSLRSVVRAMGISRMIAAELAKKARAVSPPLPRLRSKKAQRRVGEALELDEV